MIIDEQQYNKLIELIGDVKRQTNDNKSSIESLAKFTKEGFDRQDEKIEELRKDMNNGFLKIMDREAELEFKLESKINQNSLEIVNHESRLIDVEA